VRIRVVGGGPAGLYFALLAKKADPRHEITVYERNAPDATFGWGVVFSEETLGSLRDADYDSWAEITETFARWERIDIHFRGQVVRSRGHAFSGIARKRLLLILQRRCRELGVELEFHREVAALGDVPEADLVVAADGVNSAIRRELAPHLRPTERVHRTRYIWFGTDLVLPAFTFIFRETEHGMFQVHAYPFDADLSTFIVECREETWRRAGLEGVDEEGSIAFCRELFASELAGHELLSNRSLWINFVTLRCETWHHGNVVLLGDAAHTAHFTIGSGTKLAMEDAIALAGALQRHPRDLETALTHYEMERQPAVERLQQAALESAAWFEHVPRYADSDPLGFAVNLLTRSRRITHGKLAQRDPELVRRADAAFAARATGGPEPSVAPPPAFVPLRLGALELRNRLVVSPPPLDDARDGTPGEGTAERLARSARGPGLVLTEPVAVSPEGRVTPGSPGLYAPEHRRAWAAVVARIHAEGGRLALQLDHAGRRGSTRPRAIGTDLPLAEPWPVLAPSPLPFGPGSPIPRAMEAEDLDRVVAAFAEAARAAAEAGADVLEVNAARGHLLATFLSPLANHREDGYGGSLEGRMRFPLRVVEAVREAWPADRPLAVRIPGTDWAPGGWRPPDAVALAHELLARGCDLVHVDAGGITPRADPPYRREYLTALADRIRNEARAAVLVGGYLPTLDLANTVLAAGQADLCLLALPPA
jgi:anthraniloyl-CoA monooxygenase